MAAGGAAPGHRTGAACCGGGVRPAAVARLAVIVAAVVVVAVGTAGAVGHTGLFFVPALVSLVVGMSGSGARSPQRAGGENGEPVSQLAARARRLKVIAITDAGDLAQIHETASLAQAAKFPDAVISHVREQLTGLLDLQACRFEYGTLLGHPPRLESDGTVMTVHGRWNADDSGLPAEEVELRAVGGGQYFGRFMMKPNPGSKPSLQARLVAVTLADQAGRALAAGQPARGAH